MTLSAIAARYADALADVVMATGSGVRPEQAVAELQSFAAAIRSSTALRNALVSPAVPAGRKKAVVGRIGKLLGLSRISLNFLFVLIDHRRIAGLPEIIQSFEFTIDDRQGFARADVVSARALTEAQRAALNTELERLVGKRIRMRSSVDEALIGGVVARIRSTVYDGSVRGRLRALERRLAMERYS
ncbi:MAG TPA: ATP synthase F1 subunit delta [Bryobacteraceae bacterium]|nr:ATP synthase F1 subunit delta [Bryobacteraceae bacterium]